MIRKSKKCLAVVLCLSLALGLFGCGGGSEKTVKSILITEMPVVSSYIGETVAFGTPGKLSVVYSDETTDTVAITQEMMNLSELDTSKATAQTVTVTYEGKTASFSVTLTARPVTVTGIAMKTAPTVSSHIGETLAFSDYGKLTVSYSNDSSKEVAITAAMLDTTGVDTSKATAQTVTVTYEGKTASFSVTLTARPVTVTGIAMKTAPTVSSHIGETLAFSDYGKLTVSYSNDSSKEVAITAAMLDTTGVDTSKATAQTVTVTYEGKTTTFTVTLTANPATELANAKTAAKTAIDEAYAAYTLSDYSSENQAALLQAKDDGKTAVENAETIAAVNSAKAAAIAAMETVETLAEENRHIYTSVPGGYTVTPSNKGKTLTVTYNGVSQVWQPISTEGDVGHDFYKQNVYSVTAENKGTAEITMTVNITAADEVVLATSGVLRIAAGATKTIQVRPVEQAAKVLLFIDNCESTHNRAGNVVLTDFGFTQNDAYSTASEFNLADKNLYTITDKESVMANIAYTDIPSDNYVPVFYSANGYRKETNMMTVGVKNNGSSVARVAIKGGDFVNGQFVNYVNQHTAQYWGGQTADIPVGETKYFTLIMDYDGTIYPDADPVPADAKLNVLQFNFDNCWYDKPGEKRTGNLDVVFFSWSAPRT